MGQNTSKLIYGLPLYPDLFFVSLVKYVENDIWNLWVYNWPVENLEMSESTGAMGSCSACQQSKFRVWNIFCVVFFLLLKSILFRW